jgi:hypothetical protein
MKRLILLALAGFGVAISDVKAGSAVALAPHNQMVRHRCQAGKPTALAVGGIAVSWRE